MSAKVCPRADDTGCGRTASGGFACQPAHASAQDCRGIPFVPPAIGGHCQEGTDFTLPLRASRQTADHRSDKACLYDRLPTPAWLRSAPQTGCTQRPRDPASPPSPLAKTVPRVVWSKCAQALLNFSDRKGESPEDVPRTRNGPGCSPPPPHHRGHRAPLSRDGLNGDSARKEPPPGFGPTPRVLPARRKGLAVDWTASGAGDHIRDAARPGGLSRASGPVVDSWSTETTGHGLMPVRSFVLLVRSHSLVLL